MTARTIAVVTSSRADYSHLYWPLRKLNEKPQVKIQLIATGAHLAPEFGLTVEVIEEAGFVINDRVECLLSSDSDVGMAKTIGLATISFAEILAKSRPDLILLIADRYEMLAPASVAMALRIPIAHIEGGESSEGAIDHVVRNALTAMSHVHFTSTKAAALRIIAMGEEPWRVHHVGAASIDHLTLTQLPSRAELQQSLGINLDQPPLVVVYHPVTLDPNPSHEAEAMFKALVEIDHPIVFCFPNADAGNHMIRARAQFYCKSHSNARLITNLEPATYWGLLKCSALIIGNSSSGIMESASLALPAVNIGRRQDGRERARNLIDVSPEPSAISAAIHQALTSEFRSACKGVINPYGRGNSGQAIADILANIHIDSNLLTKKSIRVSG